MELIIFWILLCALEIRDFIGKFGIHFGFIGFYWIYWIYWISLDFIGFHWKFWRIWADLGG
jgi:hypothetical protein